MNPLMTGQGGSVAPFGPGLEVGFRRGPARRRNEAAPALARTRTPSWATRSRLATPAASSAAKPSVSSRSGSAPWPMRKSARLLWLTPTPPHSHWKARCSRQCRARARALPRPSMVAYSHSAIKRPRVGRRVTGPAFHRLDGRMQRGEVEALHEGPDQTRAVVRRQQIVQAQGPQLDLAALGPAQTRTPTRRCRRHRLLGQLAQQSFLLDRGHAAPPAKDINMAILTYSDARDSRRQPSQAVGVQFIHRL